MLPGQLLCWSHKMEEELAWREQQNANKGQTKGHTTRRHRVKDKKQSTLSWSNGPFSPRPHREENSLLHFQSCGQRGPPREETERAQTSPTFSLTWVKERVTSDPKISCPPKAFGFWCVWGGRGVSVQFLIWSATHSQASHSSASRMFCDLPLRTTHPLISHLAENSISQPFPPWQCLTEPSL